MAEGPLSPDLDQVLGDIPSPQQSDLDMALSELGELPPPPPSRSTDTKMGTELDDLLQNLPPEAPTKPPAPSKKPQSKPLTTKSDQIMADIYKMLAEIEVDIEKNLTPKKTLAKSDTFGISSAMKGLNTATNPAPRNVASPDEKPPIKSKPKPLVS